MVRAGGLEPQAFGSGGQRSIHLSYARRRALPDGRTQREPQGSQRDTKRDRNVKDCPGGCRWRARQDLNLRPSDP